MRVVRWRFPSFWAPNSGIFFSAGTLVDIDDFFWFGLATHPGRSGGPGTEFDTRTLPARPPPPATNLLRLPKKREAFVREKWWT
jgi:hypothetical protein